MEGKVSRIIASQSASLNSQARKFIQEGSSLIWLIVAQLHVLRIERAASGDGVLTELDSAQDLQQQADTIHGAGDELLNEAENCASKDVELIKSRIGNLLFTSRIISEPCSKMEERANHFVIKNVLAQWKMFFLSRFDA